MLGFMQGLGTRNVFTAGSQDCNNKLAGAQILHGSPLIHPLPDFAHTDLAVLLGTNPAVSQASFVHLEGGSTVFDRLVHREGGSSGSIPAGRKAPSAGASTSPFAPARIFFCSWPCSMPCGICTVPTPGWRASTC